MNNYIWIGKIVNTFGIKGEVKILSDFEFKDKVFYSNFPLYIGEEKIKEVINTYRVHKHFDLVTFKGYDNINEILKYKGKNIYILRSDLKLEDNEYLLRDLIGLEVYDEEKLLGVIIDYEMNNQAVLFKVKGLKSFYLPFIDQYIKKIDFQNRKVLTNKGSDLIL